MLSLFFIAVCRIFCWSMWDIALWPMNEPCSLYWEHRILATWPPVRRNINLGQCYSVWSVGGCRTMNYSLMGSVTVESLCVHAQSLSHVWLLCGPMDCNQPDSPVHGISQARILEWVAISFSRDPPDPGIKPTSLVSPALAGEFFTT